MYPKLVLNENWWVNNRQFNGLFHYDANNPKDVNYITHVKYESGWDNSPRWDKGISEYWAIDLNCFMVMFYRSLSFFAKELGLEKEHINWVEKEKALSLLINEKMWDTKAECYFDTNRFTKKHSAVMSPASFMPLFVEIAFENQAKSMCNIAKKYFKEKMPTVDFESPNYSTDYWRGPTWLNVAYFAAKGLKNYGFAVADIIKDNILTMCYKEKSGIYENYDSVTGKGLCCNHFSWSCVFINEFILNF